MTQLDYTFDRQIELERIDARREGKAEGLEKGLDLILEIKNGSTDEELIQHGYTLEAIKSAKETIKLNLA